MKEKSTTQVGQIYVSGGGKGGVGKSFTTIGLVDTLIQAGFKVLLIESDTSNPVSYTHLTLPTILLV